MNPLNQYTPQQINSQTYPMQSPESRNYPLISQQPSINQELQHSFNCQLAIGQLLIDQQTQSLQFNPSAQVQPSLQNLDSSQVISNNINNSLQTNIFPQRIQSPDMKEQLFSLEKLEQNSTDNLEAAEEPQLDEDDDSKLLTELALTLKLEWKKISKRYTKITGKKSTPFQLRKRYHVIKQEYGRQETFKLNQVDNERIVQLVNEIGQDWIEISKRINNGDPMQIRNRYYSVIRKKKRPNSQVDENKEEE